MAFQIYSSSTYIFSLDNQSTLSKLVLPSDDMRIPGPHELQGSSIVDSVRDLKRKPMPSFPIKDVDHHYNHYNS
eukprot:1159871-Pelagomonas_calceolata.AAC.16